MIIRFFYIEGVLLFSALTFTACSDYDDNGGINTLKMNDEIWKVPEEAAASSKLGSNWNLEISRCYDNDD